MKLHFAFILMASLVISGVLGADGEKTDPKPFKGMAQVIPGVVEAEHFDEGPAGVAYFDVDAENQGADYREPTAVDIEARPDASNQHGIGWVREKEWLIYTVEVKEAGAYTLEIPVASNKPGGRFHIEFEGKDVSGPITIPDTGGWDKLETLKVNDVSLEEGRQRMKLVMDKDGESGGIGDIDLVRFLRKAAEE